MDYIMLHNNPNHRDFMMFALPHILLANQVKEIMFFLTVSKMEYENFKKRG